MINVVLQQGHNKTPFHLGLHSDFQWKALRCNHGLVENSKCCHFNHRGDQEGHGGRILKYVGDCNPGQACVCTPESENPTLIDLDSVTWCDWVFWFVIEWLSASSLCFCSPAPGVYVHVYIRLQVCLLCGKWTLLVPWAVSPQPSSTIILIDPHLLQMAPNPDNLSSNFSSHGNPSLPHSVTYWAGLKLPTLSPSYTIITRLTTWNMNTPMSPRQPRNPHVISLDLRDASTPYSTQRSGHSCQMGRILQLIFQHVLLWVRTVKSTQKNATLTGENMKYFPAGFHVMNGDTAGTKWLDSSCPQQVLQQLHINAENVGKTYSVVEIICRYNKCVHLVFWLFAV